MVRKKVTATKKGSTPSGSIDHLLDDMNSLLDENMAGAKKSTDVPAVSTDPMWALQDGGIC